MELYRFELLYCFNRKILRWCAVKHSLYLSIYLCSHCNFATLQPWLHVGSFTCRILIHCIGTMDPYFYVPLRDTELCD